MPQAGDIIPVEFRFPRAGVNTTSSRDRMLVSEAFEMVNVRQFQRLTVGSALAEAPNTGGGSRGGLGLWNATGNGIPNHIGTWLTSDGVRHMAVFDLTNPNHVYCDVAVYNASPTALTSNASTFPQGQIRSAQFGGKLYVVGANGSNVTIGGIVDAPSFGVGAYALSQWTALPANAFGTNDQLKGPTGVAFYRASAVLVNRRSNQYIVSTVGDPNNYNYGASPFAKSAYLGNSSGIAGVPGEPIIEVFAARDDYLLFMCESSIWRLIGDPRDGGRVLLASPEVGIQERISASGALPYTADPEGRLWWIGSAGKGLYVMEPNGAPRNVSDDKARRFFRDSWAALNLLTIAYDGDSDSIVVCPQTPSALFGYSALMYHIPTGRWSADVFPFASGYKVFNNPAKAATGGARLTALYAQGNAAGLLWINDGAATDRLDNGSGTITNPVFVPSIRFAPFQLASGDAESMCLDLSAQAELGCGPVNWYWLTADSPADVLEMDHTNAVASGQFFPTGDITRDRTASVRATGGAHQLIIRGAAGANIKLQRFVARFVSKGRRRV